MLIFQLFLPKPRIAIDKKDNEKDTGGIDQDTLIA